MNDIKDINPDAVILFDFPGIKPRTQNLESISIRKGETVTFYEPSNEYTSPGIQISNVIPRTSHSPEIFSINDGQFIFNQVILGPTHISGVSEQDFVLEPKKGLNIPYSEYNEEQQIEIYSAFYNKVKKMNFDAVGLSFIQSPDTIKRMQQLIPDKILISKIENNIGYKNCSAIAKVSDGIMIDRGDLAAEVGGSDLYDAVLKISHETKKHGKFLIMATENLESFIYDRRPTLSEIMSLSHSIDIGSSVIMLSGETATNENWLTVLEWIEQFSIGENNINRPEEPLNVLETITDFNLLPTVVFSRTGAAVEEFRKQSNEQIILITDDSQTYKRFQFHSNVKTILESEAFSRNDVDYIRKNCAKLYSDGIINSEVIRVLWIAFPGHGTRLNTISLLRKEFILN
tara:strand:- start:2271 stop:3476 length:1206 start_codon:yes stop_codon:yes gene_type:complete